MANGSEMVNASDCVDVVAVLEQLSFRDLTWYGPVRAIFAAAYALTFVLGMLGNGLLVQSILSGRRYRFVSNIFLVNLAAADMLLCLTAVPLTPMRIFTRSWTLGDFLCRLIPLCQANCVLMQSLSLCLIALDRYRNIVRRADEPWTARAVGVWLLLAWLLATAINVPFFLSHRLRRRRLELSATLVMTECRFTCGELQWPSEALRRGYGCAILLVQFLLPVALMTHCYSKILSKVRAEWIVGQGSLLTRLQQQRTAVRKRKVMYVLTLMVLAFVASWLPLTVFNLLRDFHLTPGFVYAQPHFVLVSCHLVAMSSVIWNPLLYFWTSQRNRRILKRDMSALSAPRKMSAAVMARLNGMSQCASLAQSQWDLRRQTHGGNVSPGDGSTAGQMPRRRHESSNERVPPLPDLRKKLSVPVELTAMRFSSRALANRALGERRRAPPHLTAKLFRSRRETDL